MQMPAFIYIVLSTFESLKRNYVYAFNPLISPFKNKRAARHSLDHTTHVGYAFTPLLTYRSSGNAKRVEPFNIGVYSSPRCFSKNSAWRR